MRRVSIRTQITALTLIPLLVVVVSMEAYFLRDRFADLDNDLQEHGKLLARQLAGSAEYGVFSNNQAFLQGIADYTLMQNDVRSITIVDSGSRILHQASDSTGKISSSGSGDNIVLARVDLLNPISIDAESLWLYQPIVPTQVGLDDLTDAPKSQQIGAVVVEMSRRDTEKRKSKMLWFTVSVTALILAFPLYAIFLASRSITYPIRRLSEAVQEIAKGNLDVSVRVSDGTTQELGNLASGFNDMAVQLKDERAILEDRIEEATQALRAKKEEAERASHDKSHFLAVASHDLRQPLHALGLYIAELQRKAVGDEQQYLVRQVERSVESLSTLLNALLDISKLDAGAIVPHMQICDLGAMLRHVAADYQILSSLRNIRLVIHPCAEHVHSDPMLLERILTNLVSNALRYTPQNGRVMIACRRRGDRVRIEVRDNGIGISRNDQNNIYREFFQLNQPQLDSSKGLGLGLAIVDRLVKLLGHRIDLRSAPGKGSVFAVEVPIASGVSESSMAGTIDAETEIETVTDNSILAGKKLLVVDDDEMVLNSTASILLAWGCQVTLATSLSQVEQFLQNGMAWDMIISDYQLENHATGIDVITMVQQHQSQKLPCILVTGDTGPTVLKLAAVSGHHLLHKPVKPAKLRSLAIHLLEDTE
ncbi:MAG TPA: ATP-binding protein [Gallionella sp.]|nr:ATP-binding protein [Gallionella sp.]